MLSFHRLPLCPFALTFLTKRSFPGDESLFLRLHETRKTASYPSSDGSRGAMNHMPGKAQQVGRQNGTANGYCYGF